MKRILKIFLYLFLLAAFGGVSYFLVWKYEWPWWAGLSFFSGLLGLMVGLLFLKKYLLRKREAEFVKRVVAQDPAAIQGAPLHEQLHLTDLQNHWEESVKRLRESHLRQQGNPLYVLPWFIVMGETGTGKTTLIQSSQLSSPLTEIRLARGVSGTRNCDWWFFDKAIVLDTAGRYAIAQDEGKDRQEWEKFLTLVARYRKKEPINGLIITASADKLLAGSPDQLRRDGQELRQRIDHLMRTLGHKFPVYVMVTKVDLIPGIRPLGSGLSEESKRQPMGLLNTGETPYWEEFLEHALGAILAQLNDLRLLLVNRENGGTPELLLVTQEFARLRPGLAAFLRAVFEENPYQETPFFRGMFFSSGKQEGGCPAEFFQRLNLLPASAPALPVRTEGLFLKEFFDFLLPRERKLYTPILEFIRWSRLTRSLRFLSWTLLWLSLCGLLSLSFFQNLSALREFQEPHFKGLPTLTQDLSANLLLFDKFRLELEEMAAENRRWPIPRLGLDHSLILEERLERYYADLFLQGMLAPLDEALVTKISAVNARTSEDLMGEYVGHLVTRITLLKEFLKGKNPELGKRLAQLSSHIIPVVEGKLLPEVAARFGDVYFSYLLYSSDPRYHQAKIGKLQGLLAEVLQKKGDNIHWLVRKWIPQTPPVRLGEFWSGTEGDAEDEVLIPGAFTTQGRAHIEEFIQYMEETLEKPQKISRQKEEFWRWYREMYLRSWSQFARNFSQGEERLESPSEWQNMAALMATPENPYFRLLSRMGIELTPMSGGKVVPAWARVCSHLEEIRQLAGKPEEKKGTLLGKITEKGTALVEGTLKRVNEKAVQEMEKKLTLAKTWRSFAEALELMAPISASPTTAYKACTDIFSQVQDQILKDTRGPSFEVLRTQFLKFTALLRKEGESPLIDELIYGPLDFLLSYSTRITAGALQSAWEEQVLSPVQGIGRGKMLPLLFDKREGLVVKFLQGPAAPFVSRNRYGFSASKALGRRIDFSQEFFDFVNRGMEGFVVAKPEYTVTLETLPIGANEGARVKPQGNVLEVDCAQNRVVLTNLNYPESRTFQWNPQTCGPVTLKILFPHLTLTKRYDGPYGLANFLAEFRAGSRTFGPGDFPSWQKALQEMGISWVRLRYEVQGAEPILELLKKAPTEVPQYIIAERSLRPY